jgi:hypothetical protein
MFRRSAAATAAANSGSRTPQLRRADRRLTSHRGILYCLSVNPIQDKGTESRDESDFHRDMPFPGFEVDPGQIEGARSSHVEESPERKSGYRQVRWWLWPSEDPLYRSWLGYLTKALFAGLLIMLLDLALSGGRFALAFIWGPLLGLFVIGTVVRAVWRRRSARPPGTSS